jgi:ribonuclease P protein component
MRFRPEQHVRRQRDFRDAREKGRRLECGGFTLWYYRRPPTSAPVAQDAAPKPLSSEADAARPVAATDRDSGKPEIIRGPRVGVIASTSAVGSAVLRNRAKRRLREVFRHHQNLVPADVDLLLVARNSLNRLAYPAIEQKFVDACRRLFPQGS